MGTSPLSHDSQACKSLSYAVIEAVASAEDVSPDELESRLFSVIDPESLDSLFQSTVSNGTVSFVFNGYLITVSSAADVMLEPVS